MKVYAVVELYDGVPQDVAVYADAELARERALETAREFDLLDVPPDWHVSYGLWNAHAGSSRYWRHHWYDDQRDVVVAERELS
jgi:hypothetical protein